MCSKKPKIVFANKDNTCIKNKTDLGKVDAIYTIIQRYKKDKNALCYEPVITCLKKKPMNIKGCIKWLLQLLSHVNHLNNGAEKIAIDTLHIPWELEDENIFEHVQNLFQSLVTHENCSVKPVLGCLFSKLKPVISIENKEPLRINPFDFSKENLDANEKVLQLIERIFVKVPWSFDKYIDQLEERIRPYFKNHVMDHVMFTYNLLRLGDATRGKQRQRLLRGIILNLIRLDLHSPKTELESTDASDDEEESDNESEDLFPMDIDEEVGGTSSPNTSAMEHPVGHSLDMVMCLMFRYIHFKIHGGDRHKFHCLMQSQEKPLEVNGCVEGSVAKGSNGGSTSEAASGCGCRGEKHDVTAMRELYADLRNIFKEIVLPTKGLSHVQFYMFYLVCARPSLVSDFLDMLKCVFETSGTNDIRKNALNCMGSLLARGKCIQFSHVHYCLQILYNWCKTYLHQQAGNRKHHESFYCACQTIFYVFTFNYKEYTKSEKDLRLAQSLHLDELVLCELNPLRFCAPTICLNFSKITNYFQLAYCDTILQHNNRLHLPVASETADGYYDLQAPGLDMCFPFDTYLLKRSNRFIFNHYKKFEGIPEAILQYSANGSGKNDSNKKIEDADDDAMLWNSPQSFSFSYDMSPHIIYK